MSAMTRAELRAENRRGTKAWELGSLGEYGDEPYYVAAYSDKGEAERHMRRLKKSHPYVRYTLKHRKLAARHLYSGGRRSSKARAHWQSKRGW